jgi:hypothetical protein
MTEISRGFYQFLQANFSTVPRLGATTISFQTLHTQNKSLPPNNYPMRDSSRSPMHIRDTSDDFAQGKRDKQCNIVAEGSCS